MNYFVTKSKKWTSAGGKPFGRWRLLSQAPSLFSLHLIALLFVSYHDQETAKGTFWSSSLSCHVLTSDH